MRAKSQYGKLITALSRMVGICFLATGLFPSHARAQIAPWVDLKCYGISGDPLGVQLNLTHLNPLFRQLGLLDESVVVQDPQQLCVPVAKNDVTPPPDVLSIVQDLDLKCYAITGDPLGLQLRLDHINPVLQRLALPFEVVTVLDPVKLCVPVAKNGKITPQARRIVQFIDLKCYNITGDPLNLPLRLSHLNPLLQFLGAPPEDVMVFDPQQLCVPVAKNGMIPPPDVLPPIQDLDLKCYAIQGQPLDLFRLDHLNPVLQTLRPEVLFSLQPQQLCVPVKKSLPGA